MAAFDTKWLFAQWNLAWRLVWHYVRKAIPWAERFGLERFQQNYVVEGLPPALGDARLLLHEPGRCTSCGACDDVCPLLRGAGEVDGARIDAGTEFLGPMTYVVAGARDSQHFQDMRDTLSTLTGPLCGGCRRCEAACPERIPILKLAAVHQAQLHTIDKARQGTLPIVDAKRALPPWVGRDGDRQLRGP